jgi:hypothetical protein
MTQTAQQHTPGPWKFISTSTRFELNDAENFPVLRINGGMVPTEANAKLIAAAPELLQELRGAWLMLHAWLGSRPAEHGPHPEVECAIKSIETVIAKAEGRA